MRTLSSYRGEETLDVIADITEPAILIMSDTELRKLLSEEKGRMKAIKRALKYHKQEVLQIMAALDGIDPDDKEAFDEFVDGVNLFTLPRFLITIFNDPDIMSLFTLQEQMQMSSTPVSDDSEPQED